VRVWHLLSHTSQSTPPGTGYSYNGNRFGAIEGAFRNTTGVSFAELYEQRIRSVLSLESTVPGVTVGVGAAPAFTTRLAQGYTHSDRNPPQTVAYETHFGPAAGMISTPRDIVRFSRALDDGLLVTPASRTRMWTAIRTPAGAALPYGLGWFVQQYDGQTVLWHYGLWTGTSALIIKIPARGLTFVLLANSPGLSEPFPLGAGDLTKSPFAMVFLRAYVGD
jgi:CubicO group peptidase (beta-lactamase class C family)